MRVFHASLDESHASSCFVAKELWAAYRKGMLSVLADMNHADGLPNLLRPEPLPDGNEPEERFTVCGMSWERYLVFDKALGDDRPSTRLYYLAPGVSPGTRP